MSLGAHGSAELLRCSGIAVLQDDPHICEDFGKSRLVTDLGHPGDVLCEGWYELSGDSKEISGNIFHLNRAPAQPRRIKWPAALQATQLPASLVDRRACAEFLMFAELSARAQAAGLPGGDAVSGVLRIQISEPPCLSCAALLVSVAKVLPQVKLIVSIDGAMLRYGKRIASQSAGD